MRYCHICKLPGRVMGIRVLRFSLVVILVLLLVAGALTTLLPNIKEDKMLTLRREIKSQGKSTLYSFTLIMSNNADIQQNRSLTETLKSLSGCAISA